MEEASFAYVSQAELLIKVSPSFPQALAKRSLIRIYCVNLIEYLIFLLPLRSGSLFWLYNTHFGSCDQITIFTAL